MTRCKAQLAMLVQQVKRQRPPTPYKPEQKHVKDTIRPLRLSTPISGRCATQSRTEFDGSVKKTSGASS